MSSLNGFWSYVHADDQADSGRISRLANDIKDQYQMLTGDTITLFLDKDAIKWGDIWRDEISSNLASTAFLIPVLTPRYFMSPECRSELQYVARKATDLGLKNIILPLLYVDVPALHEETPVDDLIALVCTFQREDWRDLRFLDITSEGYRKSVFRLATHLVEANKQTEKPSSVIETRSDGISKNDVDDSPGIIDKLASSEVALPKMANTVQAIVKEISLIGEFMVKATEDIERGTSQGKGFASRLVVARQLSLQLTDPTEHICTLSNEYASQLHKVDEGLRIIIERAPIEIKENPKIKTNFCDLFKGLRTLSEASRVGLDSIQSMIDSSAPLEKMSRDLRPVLRRLRQGLTIMVESRSVSDAWVHLIESSGIVCESADFQL
jgi:hypothetical protein